MAITHTIRAREDAATLKDWLHDGREIALLDVREHGQYGESHLFYAVNVPYSQLEFEAARLVPRKSTRIVVYDQGNGVADKAAQALRAAGYGQVAVLDGGVQAWQAQGYALFAGVNLPSKTFGELAEHELHTPAISAEELNRRLARGDDLVVLDGRPYAEYQKMSIPGATCCPNGELALRIDELVPDEKTTIVINCAGRTRSIIGAQTLINLGIRNPVYALENGTQGWYLKDYRLDHGQTRRHGLAITPEQRERARQRAQALARRHGIAAITPEALRALQAEPDRSTYVFDVRTAEEYAQGTWPGAAHAPGGQLIQATDQYVGTRGARLVLVDGEGVRAPAVASWLRQMGWEVHVLEAAALDAPPTPAPGVPATLPRITSGQAAALLAEGRAFIDLRPSMAYRKEHIAGAQWRIRSQGEPLAHGAVLVADDARVAELYARDHGGQAGARLLLETPSQWRAAGLPLQATPALPPDEACIDFLFFVHDRHSGNKAAAIKYLEWETNLVNQIDERERASYRFTP
ncbi:rhodanese-like domain-containing protein [Bordetella hinzii]|uniref:rhodanese-like domain-containing protein n=1 Tax=Bordetella hinzii TaxID=103855 RepID=UPI0005197666|nr:rhodanese-like domain-containing protein [Bordetella hinzii]KXA74835.1 sulfurtransferase [Bordetella hinzii LMG 13501]QDJ36213.1 sulfurtransferase [Bordetella hinzii]QWF40410.1 sulfurtransferase [Bordetella hinzii]QWF44957.1 sulfurtransferase [Bordetella hinzii]QWF49493.1 sulfurtransferase [Bordetella hinzii]